MRKLVLGTAVLLLLWTTPAAAHELAARSLDGSFNNVRHPDWGAANTQYLRIAAPRYADGTGAMTTGPPARYISNRIFNDVGQNLFSENDVSRWGWVWGQFLDHTFGLRDERPAEPAPIAFATTDPLEEFRNDFGVIDFARTPAASGTGVSSPRQQVNTESSYVDATAVYGDTDSRLEWLREGPIDGTLADNGTRLLLPGGYLPRADARGNAAAAPAMDLMGRLVGTPARAVVAGDVRANENIALTAVHTLFAREHNRIVNALPARLSATDKFEIARRVVAAEEQYVTYHEFLPALGVQLAPYRGYDPSVNAGISNEFAVVGYRAHSMIHGELEPTAPDATYSASQLDGFRAEGIGVEDADGKVTLDIPLEVAFGNPDLLQSVGLGPVLESLGTERQYRNDEQIDNTLRSVLFQVPKPGVDPASCSPVVVNPNCFDGVQDLGAIDVERGRDHGMPSYNALRRAYGLAPKRSFTSITGERTAKLPRGITINDPRALKFLKLLDADGKRIKLGTDAAQEDAVRGIRRTTLAARLKAIYGSVNRVDAFVGMVSERHVRGTEFGQLQLAMWKKQFEALRDGDRFFYLNDPLLRATARRYGIDYRQTLAEIIRENTGAAVQNDVFKAPAD